MNCIHKDPVGGWCKLHSDFWSDPIPAIEYCVEGPCPDEQPTEPAETDVKVLTNADRIRSMSDEELAKWMALLKGDTVGGSAKFILEWLQQPAKEAP